MSNRHRRREAVYIAPFYEGEINKDEEFLNRMRAQGYSDAEITAHLEQVVAMNDRFTVLIRPFTSMDGAKMIHLSIKKNDRRVIDDWRELQTIKNMIVGEEITAVQVFPPEKHLVDTSNQYHLWCYMDPDFVLPFGYKYRDVMTPETAHSLGARQRPFRTLVS